MHIDFLANHPHAVPIVANWYFNQWGFKVAENSFELTCERLYGKLNRDVLPLPLVALEGTQIIGAAQLKVREMEIFPDREFWLGGIFVDSAFRGQGVAQALVETAIEKATSLGIEQLWLQTEALDGGLYAKLGWVSKEILGYKGVTVSVMVRKIP